MEHQDFAIIIQGKFAINTEEIIKFYQSIYDCHIILSIHNEPIDFDASKYNKLHLCLSDFPRQKGIGNRNIQRISTYYGIKKAKELGIKYCLKSRTDHFFKHPDLINILKSNLKLFPLFNTDGQEERIIVPNGGTTLNYYCGGIGGRGGPFHISDHWLCGTANDLYNYFDINNPYWDLNKSYNYSLPEWPIIATEAEFCTLWMKKQNINYETVSSLLKDKFIVIDNQSLDYDQVKFQTTDLLNVKTDWVAWCDPLSLNAEKWFEFWNGKIYNKEQELELNKYQKFIF